MKQSEMDRELRLLVKDQVKLRKWKFVDGTAYWTAGPLFFSLTTTARVKEKAFFSSLRFKWLELDYAFWRVLDLSSNENEPFSLHANGAFVLYGQEILERCTRDIEWQEGTLGHEVKTAVQIAFERANEVATKVTSMDSYLDFIQAEHDLFLKRYPQATVNIWKERLLVALLTGDMEGAKAIANARIAANDSGGYSSEGKTFYEHAALHC